jgi:hypothetical protein
MNDAAFLPAAAALAGSAIGGLTSVASAWLTQRYQDRVKQLLQDKSRRQSLYKQFINEASKLYADALSHDNSDISALVSLYALIGQMRILSALLWSKGRKRSLARSLRLISRRTKPFSNSESWSKGGQ